jgi:hypothetical protein
MFFEKTKGLTMINSFDTMERPRASWARSAAAVSNTSAST